MKQAIQAPDDPAVFARELLSRLDMKATLARVQIIQRLWDHARQTEHVSAEQLYRELHDASSPVGLATIYRVLAALEAAGAVRRQQFARGQTVFELSDRRLHHHMVEADGHAVLEFADAEIEKCLQCLAAAQGYEYVGSELVIYVKPRKATAVSVHHELA